MIELIFYISFLSTLGALIVFFLRQKGSYFRSVQILFLTAFISFLIIGLLDLIKNYLIISKSVVFFTTKIGVSAILIAAIAVERAALILYKKREEKLSWKLFLSKKSNLPSIIYQGYAICILILTWILTPWQTKEVGDMWGGMVYTPEYEWWYLISLIAVLAAFVAYPCRLFLLSSRKYKEKSIADALTWLGASWISIGVTLIIFHGLLRLLGYEMVEVGYSLSVLYFGIIAYLFKKTTILEGFFDTLYPPLRISGGEHVVAFYTSGVDKMRIFSTYIRDGLLAGDRVAYVYPDEEEETVRARLKEYGVEVEKYERNGSLHLMTLSQAYLPNSIFDKDKLIKFWTDFKTDTRSRGYRHERDLFDWGDLSFLKGDEEKYFDYLKEADTQLMDPYLIELRAVNIENLSEKWVKKFRFFSTKSLDLLRHLNRFSESLRLSHRQIAGRKILFEFDPASDYEKAIQSFATEALANAEPIEIFTCKGSAIHSALSNRKDIRFLLLTQRVSTPQVDTSTNEILLPANNTSLLLDALDKTLEAFPYGNLNVVFDSLSSLVLLIGFEKTYGFMRYAAEMLASPRVTALFLLNPTAHDQKVVSSLRDLFSNQVAYGKDGVQVVRLPETEVGTVLKPTTEILLARKRVEER